ncbi:MAG: type II toxin-antitoxin system RelE/ParE family toxin [Sphingobacteriaceae bacterium]|nr:MAG: type II toxin-antitoxin system RelE/ParE family toxin [Sphingobacteriaceae bacterium]
MKYIIDVSVRARQELLEASKWYDEQQSSLGEQFEEEVLKKFNLIQANPLHYPIKKRFHEALIIAFPFVVVYKIIKYRIVIVSVFHTSRHPKKKH